MWKLILEPNIIKKFDDAKTALNNAWNLVLKVVFGDLKSDNYPDDAIDSVLKASQDAIKEGEDLEALTIHDEEYRNESQLVDTVQLGRDIGALLDFHKGIF